MLTLRSSLFASANDDAPPHSSSRAVITPSLFSVVVWFARYLEPWNVMLAMRKEYPDADILKIDLIFETFYFLMTPDAAREVLLEKSTDFPLRYSIDLFKNVFVGFLHDAQRAGENARGTRQRVVQMTRLTTVLHDVPRARMRYRVRRSRSQLVSRM